MKSKYSAAILSLFLVLFPTACQKSGQWKGQITEVNGVTIVENPKRPLYDSPVLTLDEELRIGEQESRPEYIFAGVSSLAVDGDQNIYVANNKESQIKVFNPDGSYLRTIGRPGQGPGEIGRLSEIFISESDDLVVVDPRRRQVHTFSTDGDYLDSRDFEKLYPLRTTRDSTGHFYIMNPVTVPGSREGSFELLKLNPDLEPVASLTKIEISPEANSSEFDDIPEFAVRSDDCAVLGYASCYRFKILTPEGEVVREIHQNFDRVLIPEKVKEEWKKRNAQSGVPLDMEMPKYYQPFADFFLDENGRMLVIKHEQAEDGESQVCDVFDAEGKYLCRISLKAMLPVALTMSEGKLYIVEEDVDGNPFLVRYAMRWTI